MIKLKFPALMAKVKGLNSKILSENDFKNLINTNSVTEVVEYLKNNTHYDKSFENLDIQKLHRRTVEVIVRNSMLSEFYDIYFYLPMKGQKIFSLMEKRFEIENIKFILRSLHAEYPENIAKEKLFPLNHNTINYDLLASINSFDDALKVFKNTMYKSIIDSAYQNYQKTNKIQYFLNAFDFWYLKKMKSSLKSMPSYSKGLKNLFFTQMELANVQWIYRAKILFELSTKEVMNFIMPLTYNLSKQELTNLTKSENVDDFINKISSSYYGDYFKNIKKEMLPYIIERICERILLDDSKTLLRKIQNGFDVMSGYLYIREYEYRDLTTIIEGKRYEMDNEKIKSYLLLTGE